MRKMLVIVGPTAVGKTDLAIKLAQKYDGEILACDSRQLYKGLDIGTGKLPSKKTNYKKFEDYWEIDGVRIHLYDVASPKKRFDSYLYIKKAKAILKRISQKKLVIVVGGTGLYLAGLIKGLDYGKKDLELRKNLSKKSISELQQMFINKAKDVFDSLNNSEKHNRQRLIRWIEKLSSKRTKETGVEADYFILKIGIRTSKKVLHMRIDERVLERLRMGMIEEAKNLNNKGLSFRRMRELGLEYKYLAELLENKLSFDEFVIVLQTKIHQYAKRQMTWFKRDKEINWFDIEDKNFYENIVNLIDHWYNTSHAEEG